MKRNYYWWMPETKRRSITRIELTTPYIRLQAVATAKNENASATNERIKVASYHALPPK